MLIDHAAGWTIIKSFKAAHDSIQKIKILR